MWVLLEMAKPVRWSIWQEVSSTDEDEAIRRYRAMKVMAGTIEEATRHADAMARLELSLTMTAAVE